MNNTNNHPEIFLIETTTGIQLFSSDEMLQVKRSVQTGKPLPPRLQDLLVFLGQVKAKNGSKSSVKNGNNSGSMKKKQQKGRHSAHGSQKP